MDNDANQQIMIAQAKKALGLGEETTVPIFPLWKEIFLHHHTYDGTHWPKINESYHAIKFI